MGTIGLNEVLGVFLCGVFLVTTFYFIAGRFHERWRKNFVVQFVYKHMYLITVGQSVSRKGMDLHPKKMVKRLRGLTVGVLILDPLNHSFSSRGCTHHLCNLTAWTVWAFSMEKRQYASSFLFPCSFFFFFWIKSEHNKWSFKYTVASEQISTDVFLPTGCLWAPSNWNFSCSLHIPSLQCLHWPDLNRAFLMLLYGFHTYKCI